MSNKQDKETQSLSVISKPSQLVPKLATKVTVAKTNTDNYLITFISALPDEQPILIQRIAMDEKLIEEFIQVLEKAREAKDE